MKIYDCKHKNRNVKKLSDKIAEWECLQYYYKAKENFTFVFSDKKVGLKELIKKTITKVVFPRPQKSAFLTPFIDFYMENKIYRLETTRNVLSSMKTFILAPDEDVEDLTDCFIKSIDIPVVCPGSGSCSHKYPQLVTVIRASKGNKIKTCCIEVDIENFVESEEYDFTLREIIAIHDEREWYSDHVYDSIIYTLGRELGLKQ